MQEAVAIIFTFSLIAGLIVLALYFRRRRQHEVLEAQRDLQTRILERFDSPHEFSAFLQTRGGQRFLSGLTDERGWRPAKRIMLAVQIGLVITFFGLGLALLSAVLGDTDPLYPAVVIFSIGAGFLAAAAATYRMSKRWHLLPGDDEGVADLAPPAATAQDTYEPGHGES